MFKKLLSLAVFITFLATISFTSIAQAELNLTNELITQIINDVKTDMNVLVSRTIEGTVVSEALGNNNFGYYMSQGIYPMQKQTILINVGWPKQYWTGPPKTMMVVPRFFWDDPNAVLTVMINEDFCNFAPMNEDAFRGLISFEMALLYSWETGFTEEMSYIFRPDGNLYTHNDPTLYKVCGSFLLNQLSEIIPFYEFMKWAEVIAPPIMGVNQWMGLSASEFKDLHCRNIDLLVIFSIITGDDMFLEGITQQEWDIYNYLQNN